MVHVDLRNSKEAMQMVLPRPRSFFGCNINIAQAQRPDRSFGLRRLERLDWPRWCINLILCETSLSDDTSIALCKGLKRQKRRHKHQGR
jgi:hypothetical protein